MKILASQIKRVTVLRKALGPENFQDFSEMGLRSKIILLTKELNISRVFSHSLTRPLC